MKRYMGHETVHGASTGEICARNVGLAALRRQHLYADSIGVAWGDKDIHTLEDLRGASTVYDGEQRNFLF